MSSKPMQTINIRKIYLIKLHVCCMSILIDNTYGLNANNSLYFDLAEILYNAQIFLAITDILNFTCGLLDDC